MKKILGCVAVLGLAACAAPAPLGPPIVVPTGPSLSGAEVRQLVVGNTASGPMSGSIINYTMYVAPDGSAKARLPAGIDNGSWRITDDGQFCAKWSIFRGGEEYCQRVYKEGEVYKFVNNNSVELLNIVPGNKV
jgi:hypothetical protein